MTLLSVGPDFLDDGTAGAQPPPNPNLVAFDSLTEKRKQSCVVRRRACQKTRFPCLSAAEINSHPTAQKCLRSRPGVTRGRALAKLDPTTTMLYRFPCESHERCIGQSQPDSGLSSERVIVFVA